MGEGVKVFPLISEADCRSLLLHLQPDTVMVPHWRRQRPSLFVQALSRSETGNEKCSLTLEGYVRHKALSANQIITIPFFGDFAIEKIVVLRRDRQGEKNETKVEEGTIYPDPQFQESLVRQNDFVPEEEMLDDNSFVDTTLKTKKHVPKGTSEYQATWIPDDDSLSESITEISSQGTEEAPDLIPENDIDALRETRSVGDAMSAESDSDADDRKDEEMEKEALAEDEEEERQFPDEVITRTDRPARVRFQRYRGLKSFRTSPWDAKADLPQSYSRIFEFDSFAHAVKSSKKEAESSSRLNSVPAHSYVRLVLKDLPTDVVSQIQNRHALFFDNSDGPLFAVGLLKHEVKMSVVHYRVTKASDYTAPVCNKGRFLFISGFRWFEARPLFSSDNPRCDKHKMERFLHSGVHSIASVFAPITFSPMPLLAFRQSYDDELEPLRLAFVGSLHSCAPDRIILKRITLTGHVFKAFKKRAIVKGMFHNPEDVRWFKPLELWTKCGRTGYIKESLGTKGLMKCFFDNNIQHHDTICISLYKRVFPVWMEEQL